ncbi:MAG: archaeosortase A [Halapricum sp.]
MASGLVAAFAWFHQWWDALAWLVMLVFLAGSALEFYDRDLARYVLVAAWGVLALFWVASIYQFVFDQKSITEGLAVIAAIPLSLYVGYLLATGRDRLMMVSRAVAVMWAIYLPFSSLPFLRNPMIAIVTDQTAAVLSLLGAKFTVVVGNHFPPGVVVDHAPKPYNHSFVFQFPNRNGGYNIVYTIETACTGIGSMAIFGGLIAAVEAPLRRKLKALVASVGVIWILNVTRNVFIAYMFGYQRLQVFPQFVMSTFNLDTPLEVSYIVADRIVAQSLSVVALVGITYLVVTQLPEVLTIVEEGLYVLTRKEYDLQSALGASIRADGGTDPETGE